MTNYDQYEADCEKLRGLNKYVLQEFQGWLQAKKLSEKTIKSHLSNVDFFINEYLLYESPVTPPEEGLADISMYLGYWFIKKAMWASRASLKSNASSLTKFYTYFLERGLITEHDLRVLKMTIKEEMPDWIATAEQYFNDEDEDYFS
jgi:site-specific recombinase XerD